MQGTCDNPSRLDVALVAAGLFPSRQRAQAAIAAGLVRVDGKIVQQASARIAAGAGLEAEDPLPYVGRGGLKLEAALDAFGVSAQGRTAVDVGASTGGFTDCLLGRGAALVFAVDVGTGQLAESLRRDSRVINLEATDVRRLADGRLQPEPDLAVVDVSFISLRLVLEHVMRQLPASGAQIIALIKPQFEVGPSRVGKGGVVRRESDRQAAVQSVLAHAESLGLRLVGVIPSPVSGGDGNLEYLACWTLIPAGCGETTGAH